MALFYCGFFSQVLGVATSMDVILPQPGSPDGAREFASSGRRHPVLYLLHGLSDDHTIWQRRTSIERYVADMPLAVVMPSVHRSFYADMVHGYPYWTFISEELPAMARAFFPISGNREDSFVAGLSMGGYGAFKMGLTHPGRYAAVASLSGALDAATRLSETEDPPLVRDVRLAFGTGEAVRGSPNDLFRLADDLARAGTPPPMLYQCCGTEDFLYEDNQRARRHFGALGLPLTYEEGPGQHDWAYWDRQIQRVLSWLPVSGRPGP